MTWIVQAILSFLAATGFGIIFNAPRRMLFYCGFVGMTGWLIYSLFNEISGSYASVIRGAFMVALVAHIFAKLFRTPMIIFSAGIIPLVPGGWLIMRCDILLKRLFNGNLICIKSFYGVGCDCNGLVLWNIIQLIFRAGIGRKRVKKF